MKIKFQTEPEPLKYEIPSKGGNGLFNTLFAGYSYHVPIQISPDDVLNTVTTLWAKYININAEKFREFFVGHEGKKDLTYISEGTYQENRHEEFFNGLIDLIMKDQGKDLMSWSQERFSTTVIQDRLIRGAAMLASQKEYYNYGLHLMCGFSEINLLGKRYDWLDLLASIDRMPCPDENLERWKVDLHSFVINAIKAIDGDVNEEFWQSAITNKSFGSGPQDFDGWALVFNPFNEKGEWLSEMERKDILNLTVDFDIKVNDNGNEFVLSINSGVDGAIYEDGAIRPNKRLDHSIKTDDN